MAPIGLKCFPITPWRGVIRVLWKVRKKIRVWVFYLEEEIGRSLPRHFHGCERKQDCWELDAFQLNISVNIHIHVRVYVCLRSRICGKRMCTYLDTYVHVSLRNRTCLWSYRENIAFNHNAHKKSPRYWLHRQRAIDDTQILYTRPQKMLAVLPLAANLS